jgi:eukaryotic-like serine/threonine-protein kinase
MTAPTTTTEFLAIVRQSGVLNEGAFREYFHQGDADLPDDPSSCASALIKARLLTPFQAKQLLAGKSRGLILGQYKVLSQIGQGGMATVLLAEHRELDRLVALKMLPPSKAKDQLNVERFKREARAAAAVDHPNIVKVFDVLNVLGRQFIVMEYIAGKDLQSLLATNGQLHYATAISYILQAAAGLQHAHEKGFVHRDVKPANLILSKEGTVKLLDMGLARSFEPRDQLTEVLDKDGAIGTADYCSPEQALGHAQDERSDIYSLGATLYALITGAPPFKGNTTQVLTQHQFSAPPRLSKRLKAPTTRLTPQTPSGLDEVIAKMMAKQKTERYQSVEEVIEALNPFVSGSGSGGGSATETISSVRRNQTDRMAVDSSGIASPNWLRTNRLWVSAVGVLFAFVIVILLMSSGSSGTPESRGNNNPLRVEAPPEKKQQPDIRVQMEKYEATVGGDGMMPSFRVDGVEFLRSDVGISRGFYLWQDWRVLRLEDVQQTENVITAKGTVGKIRYEFAPNRLTATITNSSSGQLVVFTVLDTADAVLGDALGGWYQLPFQHESHTKEPRWARLNWVSKKSKLTMIGASCVWGPWGEEANCQVAEIIIPGGATQSLIFEAGTPSAEESAKAAPLYRKNQALNLDSPKDYQVFQRQSRKAGKVAVRGRLGVAASRIEARVTGTGPDGPLPGKWEPISLEASSRSFSAELAAPAGGWYTVDVRALEDDRTVVEEKIAHVGVGEVFVIAGQSNSTNCGEEKLKQTSGMVSTFGGRDWRLGDDPQLGVHDSSTGGSPWPAFGDALYARFRVPIGIASTGHAGSSITQWQESGDLFRTTTQRMQKLDRQGCRAVLWHQGEADATMTTDEYARRLTDLIRVNRQTVGWEVPWFVARVSYHSPTEPSFPAIRDAQKKVWDSGIAFPGPDTDALIGDNRDTGGKGIHFSGKGLRAHGAAWAEKVSAYLDIVLPE